MVNTFVVNTFDVPGTSLIRDAHSKGLIETDHRKVDDYHLRRSQLKSLKTTTERLNMIEARLQRIEDILNVLS